MSNELDFEEFNIECEDTLAWKENIYIKKIMTAKKGNTFISVSKSYNITVVSKTRDHIVLPSH